MPDKYSFCRKRYERAGAYETNSRTANANLNIVLTSTIRNPPPDMVTDWGTALFDSNEHIEHCNSDYQTDRAGDTAGSKRKGPDDMLRGEPETEVLEDNLYPVVAEHEDFPGAGEAMGEGKEYKSECRDLCENPLAPLASAQGFKLASWFIESKVSMTLINDCFSNGIGNSISLGYSCMHTLENLLRHLDPYSGYLQWLEGQVEGARGILPFFYQNVLDCVRYLRRQIAYRDDLVYAPRREYYQSGYRIYAEMHTADWWWDVQVQPRSLFYVKVY